MKILRAVATFWYDFLIGDDWKIAAAVVTVLAIGAAFVLAGDVDAHVLTALLALGVAAAFTAVLLIDVRPPRR
ncbi:MAG: hypothetical protein QM747_18180 [Nocardioides sp.]